MFAGNLALNLAFFAACLAPEGCFPAISLPAPPAPTLGPGNAAPPPTGPASSRVTRPKAIAEFYRAVRYAQARDANNKPSPLRPGSSLSPHPGSIPMESRCRPCATRAPAHIAHLFSNTCENNGRNPFVFHTYRCAKNNRPVFKHLQFEKVKNSAPAAS